MQSSMSDRELLEAMRTIARMTGLDLGEDRLERALPAFKTHLAAIQTVSAVKIELEDEPSMVFRLKQTRTNGTGRGPDRRSRHDFEAGLS